jgi:hypothetical protein
MFAILALTTNPSRRPSAMKSPNDRVDRERARAATAFGGLCSQLALAAARVRDDRDLTPWDRGVLSRAVDGFTHGAEWLRRVEGIEPATDGSSLAAPAVMNEGWIDQALPRIPTAEAAATLDGWAELLRRLADQREHAVALSVYEIFQPLAEEALKDAASEGEVLLTPSVR